MQRLFLKLSAPALRALVIGIAVFSVIFLLGGVHPVLAQTAFEQFGQASTLSTTSLPIIIARVIRVALTLVGIIFTVLIIYAGFLYLLARGEAEPIKKAKRIIQQSIIGLIIIFSAYAITTFILESLLGAAFSSSTSSVTDTYSEPFSGSLGGGIIDDHYPERGAVNIPRNTRIFVSFKEPIDPASIIADYANNPDSTALNAENILIYATDPSPTALIPGGPANALASNQVVVTHDEAFQIFVFDPVGYLGTSEGDVSYTVTFTSLLKANGQPAFTSQPPLYSWIFEVSTDIDLTPPYVVSVVPVEDAIEPRNVTIELNFNEAMDPVASTGSYIINEVPLFTNVSVFNAEGQQIEGEFEISNGYRTLSFTTTDACGEDPCGDTIYCLPPSQRVSVLAKAATINEQETPQAEPFGYTFDGLVDASSNSLDGDHDGQACGSAIDTIVCNDEGLNDNYPWSFTTTNNIEDTVPQIVSLNPGVRSQSISQGNDVLVTFNTLLKSSTVKTNSVSLWPDPYYEFWFTVRKENVLNQSTVHIEHPVLVSTEEGGWDYWPVLTQEIKSNYQICMYPAVGPGVNCSLEDRLAGRPYCCNGEASATACQSDAQPNAQANPPAVNPPINYTLPDNRETQL